VAPHGVRAGEGVRVVDGGLGLLALGTAQLHRVTALLTDLTGPAGPGPTTSIRHWDPGLPSGSTIRVFRHIRIDLETVCYLDYDSDRACSVGPNPTPGSVGAVTTVPTVCAVTTEDTVTTVSAVATHVPIPRDRYIRSVKRIKHSSSIVRIGASHAHRSP
jgi:hypothetical protein